MFVKLNTESLICRKLLLTLTSANIAITTCNTENIVLYRYRWHRLKTWIHLIIHCYQVIWDLSKILIFFLLYKEYKGLYFMKPSSQHNWDRIICYFPYRQYQKYLLMNIRDNTEKNIDIWFVNFTFIYFHLLRKIFPFIILMSQIINNYQQ